MPRVSYASVSLVRQNLHRFYSLTIPSEVLADTCFVISREEDPIEGFQRELDKKRAQEIADYVDSGLGTVPTSIILSAQENANLAYDSKAKSISFEKINKAFLIIDGQHRVYGFKLAKTALRVPVIIYDGLSKTDESRLFIDINSKQKGVRPELLLDIKRLAEYESDEEGFLRDLFDSFMENNNSMLLGRLSPSKKKPGYISRTTFNDSVKSLVKIFGTKSVDEVYDILNSYLITFEGVVLRPAALDSYLYTPVVFKAVCNFFPDAADKLKNRFGPIYSTDNFDQTLRSLATRIKPVKIKNAGQAYRPLVEHFQESFKQDFTL